MPRGYPGLDTTLWATLAVVEQLGFDADEGPFADVRFVPTGERDTAMIGVAYAGDGFGLWGPLHEGDTVLVVVPRGDPNCGPVIVSRLWMRGDAPPADMGATEGEDPVPTDDVVLRVQEGKHLTVRTSGAGRVSIVAEGDGPVDLEAKGSGHVALTQSGSGDVEVTAAAGKVHVHAVNVFVEADAQVVLGQDGVASPTQGVLNGETVDPFTGAPFFLLGGASTAVFAKKM